MKYLNITYKVICMFAICSIASLVSCDRGVEPTSKSAISFTYSGETRAGGETENDVTVWGYYYPQGDKTSTTKWVYENSFFSNGSVSEANARLGFSAKVIETDGVKKMEIVTPALPSDPEYWGSNEYHFYSIWPPVLGNEDEDIDPAKVYRAATNQSSVGLSFFYDASTQVDQLCAYTKIETTTAASKITPVNFDYGHVCAKLIFKVQKNENNSQEIIKLNSLELTRLDIKGIYNRVEEEVSWVCNQLQRAPITLFSGNEELEASAAIVVNNGYLVIPQDLYRREDAQKIQLKLTYTIYSKPLTANGSITELGQKEVTVDFPTRTISKWEGGMEYTYRIKLAAEKAEIMFGTPSIDTWREREAGATIVVQ